MAEKGGGSGAVFGKFVTQAIDLTRSDSRITRFATTVTPICHITLSLLGASGIVVLNCGREATFETRYEYRSMDGTDVSPGICDGAGCAITLAGHHKAGPLFPSRRGVSGGVFAGNDGAYSLDMWA